MNTAAALSSSRAEPLSVLTQRVLDEAHRLHENVQASMTPQHLTAHVQKTARDMGMDLPGSVIEAATHRVLSPSQPKMLTAISPSTVNHPDWAAVAVEAEARATAALKLLPEKHWRHVDTRAWFWRRFGRLAPYTCVRVSDLFERLGIEKITTSLIHEFMEVVAPTPISRAKVMVNREKIKATKNRFDRCMFAHALGHLLLGHATCSCTSSIHMPNADEVIKTRQGLPMWRPVKSFVKPRLTLAAYEAMREANRVEKQEDEAAIFMTALVLPEEVFEHDLRAGLRRMNVLANRYDMYTDVIELRWHMLARKRHDLPSLIRT